MFASDGGYDAGAESHAVLLELRRTIARHPAVTAARGHPPSLFTRVRADVDPQVFDVSSSPGVLEVRWFAGASQKMCPEFSFHYSDESGFDCGWHHEPNPHVDEWSHFQERESSDAEYRYEEVSFGSMQPVRLAWEILERLELVLQSRYEEGG